MGLKLGAAEASEYVRRNGGLKRGVRRMAQLRHNGEGPKYYRDGKIVIYDTDDLDAWIAEKLGAPVSSTAEESERRRRDVTPIAAECCRGEAPVSSEVEETERRNSVAAAAPAKK
jgi:hypothetical protein